MSATAKPNRSLSRLIATQALFAIEATRKPFQEVLVQIDNNSVSELLDIEDYDEDYDRGYVKAIVTEAIHSQSKIDKATNTILKEGWPLKSIDPLFRAVFRAASAEMILARAPIKVVINEYIEVAKAFDDRKETISFVNAVLDRISKSIL